MSSYFDGCVPHGTKLGIRIKSYIINALGERYYTGTSNVLLDKTTSFRGDYTVLKENAQVLIPRAIANARNFLDYFFRGRMRAKITDDEIIITNTSPISSVRSSSTVTFGHDHNGGNYRLMYEEDDGSLHPLVFGYDADGAGTPIECIGNCDTMSNFRPLVALRAGKSLHVPISLDLDTRVLLRRKKVIVVYDGDIGTERGISICWADRPNGGIVIRE